MTKFAANNNKSVFIKLFPFFVFKGLNFYISFDIVDVSNVSTYKQIHK